MDASLHHAWILVPEVVDGSRFVDIYTGEYRCKVYLNNNFATVEKLKKLRDAKAAELMRLTKTPTTRTPARGNGYTARSGNSSTRYPVSYTHLTLPTKRIV